MNRFRTGVSSSYEDDDAVAATTATSLPGLVLMYAPNFEQLAPAYPLYTGEVLLGRDATCSVCIPEQAVSRQHARIFERGGDFYVKDLGSRNGTLVNGTYVDELPLTAKDEIRVGDAIFKFVSEDANFYVPFRIDGLVRGDRHARDMPELVGGYRMDAIAADIERIAATELSCVVLGETGTGKEVIAHALHRASKRRGTLQAINCAAIPQNLLESELFGYRRGAFSGADRDKPGLVKLADGGTLFLDEIGDMPLDAQAKLLRVLQSKEVFPLGAQAAEHVDIRVVCATHRDLVRHVHEGKFRGDLFARLNEHAVRLPPLRDRKEDVYQLARAFVARYGRANANLSFSFMLALLHYDWPFNVRELESAIKRGLALSLTGTLDSKHLPDAVVERMKSYGGKTAPVLPKLTPGALAIDEERETSLPPETEKSAQRQPPNAPQAPPAKVPNEAELRALLLRHQGNVAAVGRELGKERMQIHRWLKRYGIDLDTYRAG
ncbi:hypothetical protein BH09MYX1_BH09MYX1_34990 [soil metagenome]